MGESCSQRNRSLTGVWQGIYSYAPGTQPPVGCTATLIEAGGLLSGSGHEPCTLGGNANETLFFSLNGRRHDAAVNFTKAYHGSNPRYSRILYDGTVNDDATEIEGRWTISASWSGRFLMTRSGHQSQVAAESEGAEARSEAPMPAR